MIITAHTPIFDDRITKRCFFEVPLFKLWQYF